MVCRCSPPLLARVGATLSPPVRSGDATFGRERETQRPWPFSSSSRSSPARARRSARACCPCCRRCCRAGATGGRRRPLGHRRSASRPPSRSRSSGWRACVDGVGLGPRRHADARGRRAARLRHRAARPARVARASRGAAGAPRALRAARGAATASGRACSSARALGFVYAPCAGPILAAVISVSAASRPHGRRRRSPTRLGSALVLLALALGGRRAGRPRSARRARPGAAARARRVMVAHRRSRWRPTSTCASRRRSPTTCPPSLVNPTKPRDARTRSPARLADLRGPSRFARRGHRATRPSPAASCRASAPAPDFTGNQRWFNTPGGRPLTLARPARPGRARRLLDLHVHQLHAHAALPEGVGRALPRATA